MLERLRFARLAAVHLSRRSQVGLSFTEVVIAVFLFSFVGLSVLSMTQVGFLAQRRNQELARATMLAQMLVAEIRVWGADIGNYQGQWGYYNREFTHPDYSHFKVKVQSQAEGLALDSPSSELESQWATTEREARTLPRAVVPVEITISWSGRAKDRLRVVTYVGEPVRNIEGATFTVKGPDPPQIGQDSSAMYKISVSDSAGYAMENLMFEWQADSRYLSPMEESKRHGRTFGVVRDKVVAPPTSDPPQPPDTSPIQCYTTYAGQNVPIVPKGLLLP